MKKKAKPTVTRLTMARLYNTGNYEHVRYEITIDVPSGTSAKQALWETARILALLQPIKRPYNLEGMKTVLAKDPSELTEREKDNLDEYRQKVAEYTRRVDQRNQALDSLDNLGGVSRKVDVKLRWDDDDNQF